MFQSARVRGALCALTLTLAIWPGGSAVMGQDTAVPPEITGFDLPSNPEYAARTRFSRLQTEVFYIDRLVGEIPMDGRPLPPRDDEADPDLPLPDRDQMAVARSISRIALAIGAGLLLWVLFRRRYEIMARLRGLSVTSTSAAPALRNAQPSAAEANSSGLIARLRGMEDRREALVLLLHAVLKAAARQNDMRLGRAETARELLRRMPTTWTHLGDARRLVLAEELVQFGGRPLPESLFEECLRQGETILTNRRVQI